MRYHTPHVYHPHIHVYLNHGSIAHKIGPELCDVLAEVADVTDESPLEANLRLAQLVGSTLGLKMCHCLFIVCCFRRAWVRRNGVGNICFLDQYVLSVIVHSGQSCLGKGIGKRQDDLWQ